MDENKILWGAQTNYNWNKRDVVTKRQLLRNPLGCSNSHFFVLDGVQHTFGPFTIVTFRQLAWFFSCTRYAYVGIAENTGGCWTSWWSRQVTDGCKIHLITGKLDRKITVYVCWAFQIFLTWACAYVWFFLGECAVPGKVDIHCNWTLN